MKQIIILILVLFTCNCFSQNSVEKSELHDLKTISKTNESKDTLKSTFKATKKPVLSHFGLKKDDVPGINDSITTKKSKNKQIIKTLEPKLLKVQSLRTKNDTISLRKKNIKK